MVGLKGKVYIYRLYNIKKIITIKGTISKIDIICPIKGMGYGSVLILKSDKGTINIHLGPRWYIEQNVKIQKGDKIEVTGSKVKYGKKEFIIAAKIINKKKSVELRDGKGNPVWIKPQLRINNK